MMEFVTIGFCGERVTIQGKLVGFCTRGPDHRGGCTHVFVDARSMPQGHAIHYLRA